MYVGQRRGNSFLYRDGESIGESSRGLFENHPPLPLSRRNERHFSLSTNLRVADGTPIRFEGAEQRFVTNREL